MTTSVLVVDDEALLCTAGTSDLTDGVFRHLVITGRSRLALYLARIPVGLSILLPLVAVGFAMVCLVTGYAGTPQPTSINEGGISVSVHLDQAQLQTWLVGDRRVADDDPRRMMRAVTMGVRSGGGAKNHGTRRITVARRCSELLGPGPQSELHGP